MSAGPASTGAAAVPEARPVVLFVDDEKGVTDGFRANMRRQPFSVVTANSAAEALEILEERHVDVLVSDEQMPGMHGSALLAEVRRTWPDVMRIILTGQASLDATIAAINDAAVFRFLTKPCRPQDLIATVLEALDSRSAAMPGADDDGRDRELLDEVIAGLRVAYQPIWSLEAAAVVAHEALMRPSHPEVNRPDLAIDLATRLGALHDLDRAVRAAVARDLATLPAGVSLFVNIFPESLTDRQLLQGDDPLVPVADRIVLEVTERASIGPTGEVRDRIDALRRCGFRIALDDLGAGYAGLNSFASLAPDIVKFDLELVRDVHRSNTRSRLVASMVTVCRDLGITSLAEGIEDRSEYDHLAEIGCDLFQGYLLARPGPPFGDVDRSVVTADVPAVLGSGPRG